MFYRYQLFRKACNDLGFAGYLDIKGNEMWCGVESGRSEAIVRFNPINGRFKFNIPNTGITSERLRYMAACSLLMTAAYKDAA